MHALFPVALFFYFETFMLRIDVQGRLDYSKWTDFTFYDSSVLMNELNFNEYLYVRYSNDSLKCI